MDAALLNDIENNMSERSVVFRCQVTWSVMCCQFNEWTTYFPRGIARRTYLGFYLLVDCYIRIMGRNHGRIAHNFSNRILSLSIGVTHHVLLSVYQTQQLTDEVSC